MTAETDLLADEDAVFEERRLVMIERLEAFCKRTKMSRTAVSIAALNDPGALAEFYKGRKPRLTTFRRFMAWIAVHEAAPPLAAENLEKENG